MGRRHRARIAVIALAAVVSGWCASLYLATAATDGTSREATRILHGVPVRIDELRGRLTANETLLAGNGCENALRNADAIIRVHLFAVGGGEQAEEAKAALGPLRRAMACNPADGFLWFALAWIEAMSGGEAARDRALRLSYLTAPYEGWVVVRRNQVFAAALDLLPEDLTKAVLSEFRFLVHHGRIGEALVILTTSGWIHHQKLIEAAESLDLWALLPFKRAVERRIGLPVGLPDADARELRPWQ